MESESSGFHVTHTMMTDDDPRFRAGSYTPFDGDVSTDKGRVDIGFFCDGCAEYIDLRMLQEHRTFHKALTVLKYKGDARPPTVQALMIRRRGVLRRMKKEVDNDKVLNPAEIQQINDSYEFLKAYLEDSYDAYRRLEEVQAVDVEAQGLSCSSRCVQGVGVCSSANERWKADMEDRLVYQDCFGNDPHKCFLGLYDGHHGSYAAETVADHLHYEFLRELQAFDPRTKCTCTYNMATKWTNRSRAREEEHSRAQSALSGAAAVHTTSSNLIQEILHMCEDKVEKLETQDGRREVVTSDPTVGDTAAAAASSQEAAAGSSYNDKMAAAFRRAYKFTDKFLAWGKNERSRVRWSGCSTFTCLVQEHESAKDFFNTVGQVSHKYTGRISSATTFNQPETLGTLYVANAGHVKGVMMRGNKLYTLSQDHTPNNQREKDRILKLGGTVTESQTEILVNGVIPATRGLGNHGDPKMKRVISGEPYTAAVPIDQYAQILILATQGVWQVLSVDEAVKITLQGLPQFQVPRPRRISGSIMTILKHQKQQQEEQRQQQQRKRELSSSTEVSHLIRETEDGVMIEVPQSRPITRETAKERVTEDKPIRKLDEDDVKDTADDVSEIEDEEWDEFPLDGEEEWRKRVLAGGKSTYSKETLTTVSDGVGGESGREGDVESDITDNRPSTSQQSIETAEKKYAQILAQRLVQAALLAGSKENVSVMIVLLPGYRLG